MSDFEEYATGLKVVELKEELKKRNLNTTGNKAALVQRLIDYENAEGGQGEVKKTEGEEGKEELKEEMPTEEADEEEEEKAGEVEAGQEEKSIEQQAEIQKEVNEEPSGERPEAVENKEVEERPEAEDKPEAPEAEKKTEVPEAEKKTEVPEAEKKTEVPEAEEKTEVPEAEEKPEAEERPPVEDGGRGEPEPVLSSPGRSLAQTGEGEMEPKETTTVEGSGEEEQHVKEQQPDEQQPDEGWVLIDKTDTENAEQNSAESGKEEPMETGAQEKAAQAEESSVQSGTNEVSDGHAREPQGTKRRGDDLGSGGVTKDRVDPTKVPDPDEPEAAEDLIAKVPLENEFEPVEDDSIVTLDSYHSDLHFKIRKDGLGGCGLTESGFANMWAGARATRGVKGGKYFYECKVEQNVPVDLPETEPHPNVLRVGWTVDDAGLDLGEVPHSYGYGGTGKVMENNNYQTYGESFGLGDVIGCFVDLESSPGVISFSKNGTHFGTAFTLPHGLSGVTMYPIVYTKNVLVSVNFNEPALFPPPEGFVPIQKAAEGHWTPAQKSPKSKADCEVVMLVGLPGCGKTMWAEKHSQLSPGKRYNILGTNAIMDKMKVSGLGRRENYSTRWDVLIKDATAMLEKIFVLASRKPRNYIIDQTNVYASAQKRKMSHFEGFKRKAVVVIPPHHELRRRAALRAKEMGKAVPEEAVNAMKANFSIPTVGALFDEVVYTDIYGNAAEKIVRQYKDDAMGLPSFPAKRPRYDGGGRGGGGGGGGGRYGGPPPRDYGAPPPHFSYYRKHENLKKREYELRIREVERASFTPIVLSSTGGMGILHPNCPLLYWRQWASFTPIVLSSTGGNGQHGHYYLQTVGITAS
eukprot:Em0014g788a